jgi:hypothetical protein
MNDPVTGPYEADPSLELKTGSDRSLDSTGPESTAVEVGSNMPSGPQRGKFTIIKEHARGGLGKVSVAVVPMCCST